MARHVHADLMIKYAEDPSVQVEYVVGGVWKPITNPSWLPEYKYRIKPKKKTAYIFYRDALGNHEAVSLSHISRERLIEMRDRFIAKGFSCSEIKTVTFK